MRKIILTLTLLSATAWAEVQETSPLSVLPAGSVINFVEPLSILPRTKSYDLPASGGPSCKLYFAASHQDRILSGEMETAEVLPSSNDVKIKTTRNLMIICKNKEAEMTVGSFREILKQIGATLKIAPPVAF
jgi:hypothetical protein